MCSSFTPWRGQWTVTRPTSIELSLQSCQTTSRFETPRPRFADRGLTRPQHLFGVRSSILSGEPVLPQTHFVEADLAVEYRRDDKLCPIADIIAHARGIDNRGDACLFLPQSFANY